MNSGYINCKTFYTIYFPDIFSCRQSKNMIEENDRIKGMSGDRGKEAGLEDKELIRRIQNGSKEYLNEIAEKYYDDIYYFCFYQTGNREESYDLTQETFLRFIRYVENYRYRNLKGYLLTIAMNLCRDYLRKQTSLEVKSDPDPASLIFEGKGEEGAFDDMDHTVDCIVLSQAFLKLTEVQREAVLLHHFYGYKNREIARMSGTSTATVKSRIRQGLDKLGRLLKEHDFK